MIELRDSNGNENFVQEGESANITATFEFEGTSFDKAAVLSLVGTLYDLENKTYINSRNAQDILDANNGTLATDGTLTLRLGPTDNVIVDTTNTPQGSVEVHVLRVKWTWNDGVEGRTGIEELAFSVERLKAVVAP